MKKIISLFLALTMVLALGACGAKETTDSGDSSTSTDSSSTESGSGDSSGTQESSGDPINVAIVGPLTGNNAFAGEAMFNGVKMALEDYNEAGGLDGRMVEWTEYDTKADANEGAMIAQKLTADGSFKAIIGPWSSTVGLAMAPIIDKAGLLMYATSPSHADLTKASEWVIRQSPLASCLAYGCADTLLENGYTNGVYLYDNTNEGATNGATMFEERFTEGGGTVSIEGYTAGTKDFTPVITKYKDQGIEFICVYGATSDSALICTQARDLDVNCLIQVNSMALTDEFNTLIAGLEEIYCCDSYAADYPSDELQAFVSEYEEAYGETPIVHAYLGYCAAQRLCEAFDQFGTDDMEAVRDYLRNGEQETALGTLTFVDGDADRPTVWSKYDTTDSVFKAVTEIPAI